MDTLENYLCTTWGSECFHKPVYVPKKSGFGYTKSKCGLVDSATFAHFWKFEIKSLLASPRWHLRSCKKCYGSDNVRLAVAIQIPSWSGPSLMTLENGILRYAGYKQNIGTYSKDYHEIINIYGLVDLNDDDDLERLEVLHSRTFPPETGFKRLTGWLLPDGQYFPCHSSEHDSVAFYIYRYVNGKNCHTVKQVEKEGWIRITKRIAYTNMEMITQEQILTLKELYARSDNDMFRHYLEEDFEEWEERQGIT